MKLIPVLVVGLLPGCGGSLRGGPEASVARGDAGLAGEGTLLVGSGNASPYELGGLPFTVAVGGTLGKSAAITRIESGFEYTHQLGTSPFGYRVGPRSGGSLAAVSGAYIGLRGGPVVMLDDVVSETEVPNLSLELFSNIGYRGDLAGVATFGASLTLGYDYFPGRFRIPAGRPLRDLDGDAIVAETRAGASWQRDSRDSSEAIEALSPAVRARRGAAWLADAHMEHASIATFSALALDLLALGAPAHLVEGANRAALDEARHARLCFHLAAIHLGRAFEPGPLPCGRIGGASFADLARASLVEGCFGEGVAASIARVRARRADSEVVRRTLRSIARDEARHAELAWEVLAWCTERDPSVNAALRSAWSDLDAERVLDDAACEALELHGDIDRRTTKRAVGRVVASVGRRLSRSLDA